MNLVVVRSSTHLEPQTTVLADGGFLGDSVELNIFNRVSQSSAATITNRGCS